MDERVYALARQDSLEYKLLTDRAGITTLEDPFLYERGELEERYEDQRWEDEIQFARLNKKTQKPISQRKYSPQSKISITLSNPETRHRLFQYMREIEPEIQLDNLTEQTEMKSTFLRYCGYTGLTGKGGKIIPFRDCPPEQIGEAARREYRPLYKTFETEIKAA